MSERKSCSCVFFESRAERIIFRTETLKARVFKVRSAEFSGVECLRAADHLCSEWLGLRDAEV